MPNRELGQPNQKADNRLRPIKQKPRYSGSSIKTFGFFGKLGFLDLDI